MSANSVEKRFGGSGGMSQVFGSAEQVHPDQELVGRNDAQVDKGDDPDLEEEVGVCQTQPGIDDGDEGKH